MDVRLLAGAQTPTTGPSVRFEELSDCRAELAEHLDTLDGEQRASSDAATAAAARGRRPGGIASPPCC
jgi:hypothetical protein